MVALVFVMGMDLVCNALLQWIVLAMETNVNPQNVTMELARSRISQWALFAGLGIHVMVQVLAAPLVMQMLIVIADTYVTQIISAFNSLDDSLSLNLPFIFLAANRFLRSCLADQWWQGR